MGEIQQFQFGWWEPEKATPKRAPVAKAPPAIDYVVVLPWNFKKTFPPPLPEAIQEGVFRTEKVTPEQVASIHAERAKKCLGMLRHIDSIEKARAEGIDPRTGIPPRNSAAAERLQKYFESAPKQIRKNMDVMVEEYENGFGSDAATAFREAVQAWHDGIEILANPEPETIEIRFEPKERKRSEDRVRRGDCK